MHKFNFSLRFLQVSRDAGDTRSMKNSQVPYYVDKCLGFMQVMLLRPECKLDHPDLTRARNDPSQANPTLVDRDEWVSEMVEEFIANYKDARVGGWFGESCGAMCGYQPVADANGG